VALRLQLPAAMRPQASLPTPLRAALSAALVLAAAGLSSCATSGVNQGDVNLVSLEEEWALGQKLEADIARQVRLVDDRSIVGYVDALGQRIVRQTELGRLPWEFHVVADGEVNAFNIPGGHVYVNTGLIAAAGDVGELAGVLAHEISHGVARHGTEQLTRVYGLNIVAGVLLGNDPQTYERILAQILGTGAIARFSRSAEREADDLGVRFMWEAGYDPNGMVRMFEGLLSRRRGQPSSVDKFFATHPLTEERIRATRAEIAKLPAKSGLISRDAAYQSVRGEVGRYN